MHAPKLQYPSSDGVGLLEIWKDFTRSTNSTSFAMAMTAMMRTMLMPCNGSDDGDNVTNDANAVCCNGSDDGDEDADADADAVHCDPSALQWQQRRGLGH
jgi:hypothetical protein